MVAYQAVGMIRGICGACRQSNELHHGTDGKMYCEDCLVRGKKEPERAENNETHDEVSYMAPQQVSEELDKKYKYVDFIISNATPKWIQTFVQRSVIENLQWVKLVENESNARILLRMATELGYGKNPPRISEILKGVPPLVIEKPIHRKAKKQRPKGAAADTDSSGTA